MGLGRRKNLCALACAIAVAVVLLPRPTGARTVIYACFGRAATLVGTPEADQLVGTSGRDVIVGRGGDDVIVGNDGDDLICGRSGDDRLHGRYGNDRLDGGHDDDRAGGGPGDDLVEGGGGRDILFGGDGNNDRDTVVGGPGDDHLRGGDGGSDLEHLFGGDGNDTLDGGEGGRDHLYGGPGDDYIWGRGSDVASFEFSPSGVTVDTSTTSALVDNAVGEGSDALEGVRGVWGSQHDDDISVDERVVSVRGFEGEDSIVGRAPFAQIDGGDGNDTIAGGPGRDAIVFVDSAQGVVVDLGAGIATGAGVDTFTGFEDITGSFFDDDLTGDDGPNSIYGSYGTNAIHALAGDDYLEFGDSGDAGAGVDQCIWTVLDGCEQMGHFDPPGLPFISSPEHEVELNGIARISGGVAGGLGGPRDSSVVIVTLRRMTSDGCSWWNRARARFERGACGVPVRNEVPNEQGRWSTRVNAQLRPGRYEVAVSWRKFFANGCNGAFAPMCVSVDVTGS